MSNQVECKAAPTLRVLHVLSGDLWAGKECQVVLQLKALRELRCEAQLLLFNEGETARRARASNIPVTVLDEKAGFRQLAARAVTLAREFRPHIVTAHGHKELIIALAISRRQSSNAPEPRIISAFHGAPELHAGLGKLKIFCTLFLRKLISRLFATRLTAVSEDLIDTLRLPAAKTHVVYNVATPALEPGRAERSKAILVVGRLVGVKRVNLALESFAALKAKVHQFEELELQIIGDGPLKASLQLQTSALGIASQVKFLGFCADAPARIANAGVLLLTSLREGIPTVILEALYARTPFVATPLPGVREVLALLPPVPAIITKDSDPSTIAEAIGLLLSLPPKEAAVDAAISSVRWPEELEPALDAYFSPTAVAKRLTTIYQEVLDA